MSLYNQILGVHPFAKNLFALLDLSVKDGEYPVGRIRDLYVVKMDDKLIIVLYTRNGGGNRPDFKFVFDSLATHPCYIKDYDCDLDNTYAYVEFSVPKDTEHFVQEIYDVAPEERGTKMFMNVINDIKNDNKTPFTKKAMEIGKKIFDNIKDIESGGIIEV